MLFLTWNIGNTMETIRSIKDYQPTPERIKAHEDHENKRREFCRQLAISHAEKWGEIRSNKSKKKK